MTHTEGFSEKCVLSVRNYDIMQENHQMDKTSEGATQGTVLCVEVI